MPIIAASILSSDFMTLAHTIEECEEAGIDWLHIDVMDGHFVPNLTFGAKVIADIRKITKLPLDVHLMVSNPADCLEKFIDAGADYLTFHLEAECHAHRLIQDIKRMGVKPGIAIVPSTPVCNVSELLTEVQIVLVMTVNPGWGGQSLIPQTLKKVESLASWKEKHNEIFQISVDGGITKETGKKAVASGANVLISGSDFCGSSHKKQYVAALRQINS